mgnify:CR=1 FL=1
MTAQAREADRRYRSAETEPRSPERIRKQRAVSDARQPSVYPEVSVPDRLCRSERRSDSRSDEIAYGGRRISLAAVADQILGHDARLDRPVDRLADGLSLLFEPHVLEQHGGRKDRRHRIGDVLARGLRIASVNRLTLDGLVLREIRFGDKPTVLLHLFGNLIGNRPFIERIRAVLRNQLQTFCQVLQVFLFAPSNKR